VIRYVGDASKGVPQNRMFQSGTEESDYLNEPDKMRMRKNMRLAGTQPFASATG